MSADRFEELLSRWENGAATPEDLREIEVLLRASAGHRKTFLQRALLEVDLHETYSGEIAEAVRQSPQPAAVRRFPWGRLGVAWAAGLLLAVLAGTLLLRPGEPPGRTPAGLVRVSGTEPRVFDLEDGSRVELRPGTVVTFLGRRGDARQLVELREGAGTFRVVVGSGDFQVKTPHGAVTASDADFEVEIPHPGGLAVRSSRGQVKAAHGEEWLFLAAGQSHVFETVSPEPPRRETPSERPPRGERPEERKKPGETPTDPNVRPKEEKK